MKDYITIGTRGSALAIWQTEWVKAELYKIFPQLKIKTEIIKTTGDKILDSPLSKIGNKGLFTKELENALLEKRIDLAVHSLKDIPTKLPEGLFIAAVSEREDTRDVFISSTKQIFTRIEDLPGNSKIATGSLRRKCQLLNWRPDLDIIDIRGNLNTRFVKLDESDWAGMLLAHAGVIRLGWEDRISQIIPHEKILPAVGQGALGIEIRADDKSTFDYIARLNHKETNLAATGERALLRHLEGGCQVPIGAYGKIQNKTFYLDAIIGSLDGKRIVRDSIDGRPEESEKLGIELADILLSKGGKEILAEIR
jgi:hydroxymethylbilane synthase